MTGNEYQWLAMRTNDRKNSERLTVKMDNWNWKAEDLGGIICSCLGLSGEVGELTDMVKKWIFHEKPMTEEDIVHLQKELGDVMWYVVMMCESMGWKMEDIMQMNVDKLIERYPKGFDPYLANHRKEGDV